METTIAGLLASAERGDASAAKALFATLYGELHRMARRELARLGGPPALSATTLLHEAYLDIAAREGAVFPDRHRFMAYASRVMRGLIIDMPAGGAHRSAAACSSSPPSTRPGPTPSPTPASSSVSPMRLTTSPRGIPSWRRSWT